ncbi:hypothetical protein GOV13_01495 [Candidatus Pacearchaeota archaeon]|nr:hypothetical protein [Candidatus Pacearchaeota archaeon]
MAVARDGQYIAAKCSGMQWLDIEKGHVYIIKSPMPERKVVGEMSLEEAQDKYGKEKVFVTSSDSFCDSCDRKAEELEK